MGKTLIIRNIPGPVFTGVAEVARKSRRLAAGMAHQGMEKRLVPRG